MKMTVYNSASVDVTPLFKSCVKTIQTCNKAIGITYPHAKIFPAISSSTFFSKARDIQANIKSHANLLFEHKTKYVNDNLKSLSDIDKSYMDKVSCFFACFLINKLTFNRNDYSSLKIIFF